MRKSLFIIFVFTSILSSGQLKTFSIVPVAIDKKKFSHDSLDIIETYRFNHYTVTIGWTLETPQKPKLLITNRAGRVIYSKLGPNDSYFFRPTFFSADPTKDPTIILAETG